MLEAISWLVYGTLAVVAVLFWMRRRTVAAAWLAATFATLGAVVLQGAVIPPVDPADLPLEQFSPREIYSDVVGIALLAFPYLLHRFARSLRGRVGISGRLADVGMVAVVVAMIAAPGFPPPGELSPGMQLLQLILIAWFVVVLFSVAVTLVRAGIGRPGVVRKRMRLMAAASVLLSLALMVSVAASGDEGGAVRILSQVLGWTSAAGFLLAFEPPQALRRIWRVAEEDALREAETGLVRAVTAEEAAQSIVGAAAALVGGDAAEVLDRHGEVLARTSDDQPAASAGPTSTADAAPDSAAGDPTDRVIAIRGSAATVRVWRSSLTPVFGEGEEALLTQLCSHLDLALERISAYEESERARKETQRANEELTQLVYGVSHDLRNPLVTVLGFIKLLKAGKGVLDERQAMAVERIAVSAQYMEGLIDDLLQLSRIGRADNDAKEVDVIETVEDISRDVLSRHPDVSCEARGEAVVAMNPVRTRQLFTNLIENAVRHGGRPLHIAIRARELDGRTAEVLVADDGVGIPSEDRDRVFQIFQRLERFDASAEGSGIGLTMCRRIVEDVGGTIDIIDTERGTTFRLALPLSQSAGRAAERSGTMSSQKA